MKLIKNTSLRIRLMIILSCSALAIWLISTMVAWLQVRSEVNEVFDAQQILFAKRLASSDLRTILIEHHNHNPDFPRHQRNSKFMKKMRYDDDAFAFAIFTAEGQIVLSDGQNGDNFLFEEARGFSHSQIRNDDDLWRIFWLPAANGRLIIAVGQEIDYRNDLIYSMVFGQMWIWFASLPFLLALIILVIKRELAILSLLGDQLNQRTPEDNSLLETENVPKEIIPFVDNLNNFFDRTSLMLLRERRFTSDAAHELRSPLAALQIQAEVAKLAGEDLALREQALNNLMSGIQRASQLIEQLLTLSRLDNLQQLDNLQEIHWQQLITSLIGELYFSAQKRNIELIFEHQSSPKLQQGQPLLVALMLRNLIDNGIKYCREGSVIKVILTAEKIVVEDNGGGVNEDEVIKLGQRFYRPAGQNEKGSGLGLSIVMRIAELHGYQVRLENVMNESQQKGLKVDIFL